MEGLKGGTGKREYNKNTTLGKANKQKEGSLRKGTANGYH